MKSSQSFLCLIVRFFCRRPLQYCSQIEKYLKPEFVFIAAISNYHLKSCPCNEKMSSPTFCCCVYTINVIAYLFCPALIHMFLLNSQFFKKLRYFRKYYITMVYIMDVQKRVTNVTVVWLWYNFILLLLSEVTFRCK